MRGCIDNCPGLANPDQSDSDGNGIGDACESCPPLPDDDGDGIGNACDNCPDVANPLQEDADTDALGDKCACWPSDASNPPPGVVPRLDLTSPGGVALVEWQAAPGASAHDIHRGFTESGHTLHGALASLQCFERVPGGAGSVIDPVTRRAGLIFYLVSGACDRAQGTLGDTSSRDARWPPPWTRPPCPEPFRDGDGDGVQDVEDTCPSLADPAQSDRDGDGFHEEGPSSQARNVRVSAVVLRPPRWRGGLGARTELVSVGSGSGGGWGASLLPGARSPVGLGFLLRELGGFEERGVLRSVVLPFALEVPEGIRKGHGAPISRTTSRVKPGSESPGTGRELSESLFLKAVRVRGALNAW